MEKIIWDKNYSVGLDEIDKQHKKLIEIINQLIDAQDASVRSEAVSDTLTNMMSYASYHFQAEEEYLKKYNYPDYVSHHKEHMEFIRKTAEFSMETVALKKSIPTEILSYLKDWLTVHILESDMKYKDYFESKGLSVS